MGKRLGVALIGGAAAATLMLAGCSSSNSSSSHDVSPTASPTSTSSSSASPGTFTKTFGNFKLTLTNGSTLPAGWPNIPAPNNGTLQATGTAQLVDGDEQLLAAMYMAPGTESSVETAQTQQMKADGWVGGHFENGAMAFERQHAVAFIAVVDNPSTGGVTVYQWAPEFHLPQASASASKS